MFGVREKFIIILAILISVSICRSGDQTNCPTPPQDEKAKWTKLFKIEENWQKLPPEEKYRRMKEWRLKMEQGLSTLRTKRAEGALSESELKRLEKMEQMLKKLDERLSTVTNLSKTYDSSVGNSLTNKPANNPENENKK